MLFRNAREWCNWCIEVIALVPAPNSPPTQFTHKDKKGMRRCRVLSFVLINVVGPWGELQNCLINLKLLVLRLCCYFFFIFYHKQYLFFCFQVFIDHPSFQRSGTPYGDTYGAFGDNQVLRWFTLSKLDYLLNFNIPIMYFHPMGLGLMNRLYFTINVQW